MQETLIVWIQSHLHPQWDSFFETVTFWGGFKGSIFLWSFFVWCVSYSYGCRLILLTQVVQYVGSIWLKTLFAVPRPFQSSSQVMAIVSEKGFSFPSGHAINAIIFWGYFAWFFKKKWAILLSVILILLISFSRVYLGLHYPTDILGGWFLGGLFLWLFFRRLPNLEKFFGHLNSLVQLGWALAAGFLFSFLLIGFAPNGVVPSWALANLLLYLSVVIGWILKNRWLKFETDGSWRIKMVRLIAGNMVLFPVMHFYYKENWFFAFAGLWLTFGAPALFQALKLTTNKEEL